MDNTTDKPSPGRPPRATDNRVIINAKDFELMYKETYKIIDNGITLVTEGKKEEASKELQNGLKLLDQALSVKIESFDIKASEVQLYAEMQNKMRNTRKEVLLHFGDVQSSTLSGNASEEEPPSYDDYLKSLINKDSTATDALSVTYPTLNPNDFKIQDDALEEIMNYGNVATPLMSPQNGEMIFQIENGVQIFFVYANGRVTSPSHPAFLAIFTFPDPLCSNVETGNPGARGFLQVGEWSYPLVRAQSPVLHSFYGAYMFPDPNNSEPGTSVGILIPDTVDSDTKEMFEQILIQMTSFQEQKVPKGVDAQVEREKLMQKSTSVRIAEGAEALSRGVVWGAEKLSELIASGSEKIKGSLQPETQPRPVDPKWQTTAKVARNVSGKAVRVSGFVLNQLGKATVAIGRTVAPTIKKHGTKAVGRFTGQADKDASNQVEGVMEVASGAVKGASAIYMSLENAAAILAKSVSDSTVNVVSHRYGNEYGEVTGDALYAVGQTAMVGHNLSSLGVKGLAKRAAKDTGRAVIESYDKKSGRPNYQDEVMDGIEQAKEVTENDLPKKSK